LPPDGVDGDALGICDQASSTIRIQTHLQEDKQAAVLMHEITHACLDESPMSGRKRFDVEEVCDIVGYHILVVLRDNPKVLDWILQEIKEDGESV
jgi:Zn-dependent peptidase ImmA (M78 family)